MVAHWGKVFVVPANAVTVYVYILSAHQKNIKPIQNHKNITSSRNCINVCTLLLLPDVEVYCIFAVSYMINQQCLLAAYSAILRQVCILGAEEPTWGWLYSLCTQRLQCSPLFLMALTSSLLPFVQPISVFSVPCRKKNARAFTVVAGGKKHRQLNRTNRI